MKCPEGNKKEVAGWVCAKCKRLEYCLRELENFSKVK
jgi:hypothetical protein